MEITPKNQEAWINSVVKNHKLISELKIEKNMSNKQTAAVEWLIKKLTNRQNGVFDGLPHLSLDEIYAEAKAIERKQIEDAYNQDLYGGLEGGKKFNDGLDYFISTFTEENS